MLTKKKSTKIRDIYIRQRRRHGNLAKHLALSVMVNIDAHRLAVAIKLKSEALSVSLVVFTTFKKKMLILPITPCPWRANTFCECPSYRQPPEPVSATKTHRGSYALSVGKSVDRQSKHIQLLDQNNKRGFCRLANLAVPVV